jgi:hypothetical protein
VGPPPGQDFIDRLSLVGAFYFAALTEVPSPAGGPREAKPLGWSKFSLWILYVKEGREEMEGRSDWAYSDSCIHHTLVFLTTPSLLCSFLSR